MKKEKPHGTFKWPLPKNGFVFKLLFGSDTPESKELLLHFLNDVFNVPESHSLAAIQILNPNFKKYYLLDKQIALDIHVYIPGQGDRHSVPEELSALSPENPINWDSEPVPMSHPKSKHFY